MEAFLLVREKTVNNENLKWNAKKKISMHVPKPRGEIEAFGDF